MEKKYGVNFALKFWKKPECRTNCLSQSNLPGQIVEEDDSPFPTHDGKYFWSKLRFASCDGIYRWFHYDQIHRNVFAQELAHGRWYMRDVETCEFEEFYWSTRAAEEIAEKNQTIATQRLREKGAPVLYVKREYPRSKLVSRAVPTKMSPTFPKAFDSFKNMVYNFNGKGQQLVPRTPSGFPIYPSDRSRGPLFPVNVTTREPEFLYNEDGVLVLPVNERGLVILPCDLYGQLKFPLDETGSLIWPIDDEGMPYPPVNAQGIPTVRYDENGLPILPYDNSGEQLIMFDQNGIPMKLSEFRQKFSEEQAKSWGGGKLPPHLGMPVAVASVHQSSAPPSSSRAPDPPNPLPFLQTNAPSLELPEIPPEYNLAMAKLAARNLTGKFQLEYSIEIKHWEEEMEKRRHEMMKQNSEEREKYEKARHEEEERKKRLSSFLRKSTKEPVIVEKKDTKRTRDRLREEEGKKKTEAEKEVQKYYDEATKKEMEKQKNYLQASSPSSTDTYQGMDSPEQRPRSRKRRHQDGNDHVKSRNQRVYVSGERKGRNSSHPDDQRSESKSVDSVATEDKRTRKKRASSRSLERSEKSQSGEKSRKRKKSKKSNKHKREKKRKRDKEHSKSPRDSSIERLEFDLEDRKVHKVHVEETNEPLKTDQLQSEPVIDSRCSPSVKEEPEKTVDEETSKEQPNDDLADISVEIPEALDEEEEVRRRLLIKQHERIAARKAAEVVKSEPSINTEAPIVAVCPIQPPTAPILPSSSSANLGSQEGNCAEVFTQNVPYNETTLNSFKQLADGYLREMDSYLTEIRRERELLQRERLKHKKMLIRARLLNEDDNSDDEEQHERVAHRKVLLQNDQSNSVSIPSSSKIYINPAVLQRRNAERFGK
ncbi:unnamed protein product, partial [Mesorhabditis belari]|uniref:Uncharacterized protein n=1 Tax=Mesorhabditis belari TaxID=2138241 RepID=A0AAF3E9F7_9BILA